MNLSRIAATAGIAGALSFAALGPGTALAHADNDDQPLPPGPGSNGPGPGDPANGQYRDIPLAPPGAPPPPPPSWANGAPVVYDWGGHQWGVWWNGAFLPLTIPAIPPDGS
jgi:hypothetical protein